MPEKVWFAVPERVVRPHLEALAERGIVPVRRTVKVEPYTLDALVFPDPASAPNLELIFGDQSVTEEICRAGNRKIQYLCGQAGTVIVKPKEKDSDQEQGENERKVEDSFVYRKLLESMNRLSRLLGGADITLHQERRSAGPPPRPDQDGRIDIYPWAYPPGESEEYFLARAFGSLIHEDGSMVKTFRGVPGRGEFVGDGKNDLAQIIGNTWYLLIPLVEFFNQHSTEKILERLLAVIVRQQQKAKSSRSPDRAIPLTRGTFTALTEKWIGEWAEELTKVIRESEERQEQLRTDLARVQRSIVEFRRAVAALQECQGSKKILDSMPQQWRRIRSNSRVTGIAKVGDGMHVTTVPLSIVHEGRTYPLGRFVIRISKKGVLSVWNLDRLHADGVPHPHINKSGTPCMGNATSAIDQAAAEHRYADAVEYTIRWLADGYEERLAINKITEWPYLEQRPDGSTISVIALESSPFADLEIEEVGRRRVRMSV